MTDSGNKQREESKRSKKVKELGLQVGVQRCTIYSPLVSSTTVQRRKVQYAACPVYLIVQSGKRLLCKGRSILILGKRTIMGAISVRTHSMPVRGKDATKREGYVDCKRPRQDTLGDPPS